MTCLHCSNQHIKFLRPLHESDIIHTSFTSPDAGHWLQIKFGVGFQYQKFLQIQAELTNVGGWFGSVQCIQRQWEGESGLVAQQLSNMSANKFVKNFRGRKKKMCWFAGFHSMKCFNPPGLCVFLLFFFLRVLDLCDAHSPLQFCNYTLYDESTC